MGLSHPSHIHILGCFPNKADPPRAHVGHRGGAFSCANTLYRGDGHRLYLRDILSIMRLGISSLAVLGIADGGGVLHIEVFGLFFIVSRVGIRVVFISVFPSPCPPYWELVMSQCGNTPKIPLLTSSVSIVLRGGFANIPRAQVRSRYVRKGALSKIMGAFIPRA